MFPIIFRWKRHDITILSNLFTLWIPERGHIWLQETSKQIKMQQDKGMIGSPEIPKTQNGHKIENENFTAEIFSPFFKRPKNRFLWQKSGKFIIAFGRNAAKRAFLTKNDQILGKNGQKIENKNFRAEIFSPFFKRPKNRFVWQKSGKFIVAFGRNGPKRAREWIYRFLPEVKTSREPIIN